MLKQFYRFATTVSKEKKIPVFPHIEYMSAWQIQNFGGLDNLELSRTTAVPEIKKPRDVIVKVLASSINPLDVAMIGGYGNVLLDSLRQFDFNCCHKSSSPLTLGRDFAGEVISKGTSVRGDIKVGNVVYGVVPPHYRGSHADQVVTDDHMLALKPTGLSLPQAASLPYTCLTAWSALKITGELALTPDCSGKSVLVIGSSGGVGTVAVQMLKAWGAKVVATCRTDAISLVKNLGADVVIDYSIRDAMGQLENSGKYDIILDAAGNINPSTYVTFLKDWSNSKFITLRSPFLTNTDSLGVFGGMMKNAADLVYSNVSSGAVTKGSTVRWGFFMPLEVGVREVHKLVEDGKIKPIIDSIYQFDEMREAYKRINAGHLRGKVVVSHVPLKELSIGLKDVEVEIPKKG